MSFSARILLSSSVLLLAACTTVHTPITRESELKSESSKADFAAVGLTLSYFSANALKPDWEFFLTIKERNTGSKKLFKMRLTQPVRTERGDKAGFLFSVPPGKYDIDDLYFMVPERTKSGKTVGTLKLPVKLPPTFPLLNVEAKTFTHLGELRIEGKAVGTKDGSSRTELALLYVPYAPAQATVWNPLTQSLSQLKIFNIDSAPEGKLRVVPSKITVDHTTESTTATAVAAAGGGESLRAFVALLSQANGYAFFEEPDGKVLRVKAKPVGNLFLYSLVVDSSKFIKFRGVCFETLYSASLKAPLDCTVEAARQVTTHTQNKNPLLPQVVRWVGFVKLNAANGELTMAHGLPPESVPLLQKEFPNTFFRTFVLGEAMRERDASTYSFLDDTKQKRAAWDPISRQYLQRVGPVLNQCVARLVKEDPQAQTVFTLWFAPRPGGRLELSPQQSQGLVGPGLQILSECLEPEMATWGEAPRASIGQGFGVVFE